MTFNTGNPIGSTDARDRSDNSENMDILENSTTLNAHADRLGTMRKTRKGMELEHDNQIAAHETEHDNQISAHETEHDNQMQAFESDFDGRLAGMAFTRVGSFTTGATLADMRQVLVWEVSQGGDGHEYGWTGSFSQSGKVVIAGSNPGTTGGIGAGAWVDRTDVVLRNELLLESGTNHINGTQLSFLNYGAFLSHDGSANRIDINRYLFTRDSAHDGGSVAAVISSSLYVFTTSGAAYKYIDRGWEIDTASTGDAVQACIDYMTLRPFGGRVVHMSSTLILDYLNIKAQVELVGAGENEIKTLHTASAHHACVYLKDYAAIRNIRVCGSDYMRQSGGSDYIAFNKIGVTTQGALQAIGTEVENVGFSQIVNTCVLAFDGMNSMSISKCYTYGNMAGFYAETDSNHLVTNWNVARDSAKLAAGTQCYALTNFYNSGSNVYDITIHNNHVRNINDTFFAANGATATGHKVYANSSIKDADGFFGGYGLDFNGGKNNIAWGNTFEGHSVGGYYHAGAYKNQAYGNTYKTPIGSLFESSAKSNRSYHNDIILSSFGDSSKQTPNKQSVGALTVSSAIRNFVDDDISVAVTSTGALSGSVTSASAGTGGRVRLNIPGHEIGRLQLIEVFGVNASSNGLWRVGVIDADNIELVGSVWSGSYTSGGTYYSAVCGVAVGRDSSSTSTTIYSDADSEDLAVGCWADSTLTSSVIGGSMRFTNVTRPKKGAGALANSLIETVGLSGSGVAAKNLRGFVSIPASTTTLTVTFANQEPDANYFVFYSSTPANNNPFTVSQTANGFTIGCDSSAFARTVNWFIVR